MNKTFGFLPAVIAALVGLSCGSGAGSFAISRQIGTSSQTDTDGSVRTVTVANLPSTTLNPSTYTNGLYMEVTNLLATHQPQLSVMVCSYNQDKTRNQLCYVSDVLIAYQATGKFYLDQASFNNMLAISTNNAIQFEFNDTYSNSLIHWHCSENRSTQVLKPTALVHMVVTATQINILSYSCTVTQS